MSLASGTFIFLTPRSTSIYHSFSLHASQAIDSLSYGVLTILRENSSSRLQLWSRPDEKESRMLNRAFYGYDEFALFRSPSICFNRSAVSRLHVSRKFRDESAARNREMLIADSTDHCTLTMHRVKKFVARFVESGQALDQRKSFSELFVFSCGVTLPRLRTVSRLKVLQAINLWLYSVLTTFTRELSLYYNVPTMLPETSTWLRVMA